MTVQENNDHQVQFSSISRVGRYMFLERPPLSQSAAKKAAPEGDSKLSSAKKLPRTSLA